ncbi:MAG: hypothetical protein RLZZ459_2040 [Cyanobacteriota bacterium]|jgi:hypothetical protein
MENHSPAEELAALDLEVPPRPTAAEVAAALARLAAGVDQLMALAFRSPRW